MTYQLGQGRIYTLSESALNHIISGDISERQDKDISGHTVLKKIIAGSLHTFQAWNTFLGFRPDITRSLLVNPASRSLPTSRIQRELCKSYIIKK